VWRTQTSIDELRAAGQSVWLDYLRRGLIKSGELQKMVRQGWIRGVTSNPTIFQKAISGSRDYEESISRIAAEGLSGYDAFLQLAGEDIRLAADVLRPVYDESGGADGFVSFEAQPAGAAAMVAEARRMFQVVGRPNVMIKIPGVPEGPRAVEDLTSDGINVNITLLFDVDVYERFAEAYIRGLERRLEDGLPVDRIASVASFFVSRVDTKADKRLAEGSPLRGRIAIANAVAAYRRFQDVFSGPRWERLQQAGAMLQRPLWASTGTKNPEYSDVLYVEELVAPHTVNTMPEATLNAFLDHGRVQPNAVSDAIPESERILEEAATAGIDLHAIAAELLDEGLAAFGADFEKLLAEIEKAMQRQAPDWTAARGTLTGGADVSRALASRLAELERAEVICRIWRGDFRVWAEDATEITKPNRLGWLTVVDQMREETDGLRRFAEEVRADGIDSVVLLGMGGSSLAPEVLYSVYGGHGVQLQMLDTTVAADILRVERSIDLRKTLFIVASKSGTTIETTSQFAYFWDKAPDGRHFVAITDPGTPLAALGRERGFRRVFLNPESIGGRYSALSFFGLVPAALLGIDLDAFLDTAEEMQQACHYCLPPEENPGAWLGAILGEAALAGRDKLTLVLPDELASLGDWLEQLIAESTGKLGRGILPVAGEKLGPPEAYGVDRVFVALGSHASLVALEAAGHPVVRLPFRGPEQLSAEFYRWEFATAVAGHILEINPFDQPNVQQSKDAAARHLQSGPYTPARMKSVLELLQVVRPGDYISILAYLPRTATTRARLEELRSKLRRRFTVATTIGFGPRYLHSTGQIHKGGANNGVFFQLLEDDPEDIPIPGKPFSFGALKRAQADGDLEALLQAGRRAVRTRPDLLEAALR
jgi:transaldolase/glucose-6-phosphate isomerase